MKLQEFMRPEPKDEWGLKDLQNCLLNIMKYIHDFCESNNIEYFIMGGTALGAVRHGGFIPWDDDIDIFMTPESYEKFRYYFNLKGDKDNFYLQELGLSEGMVVQGKLRLNNSEYIEEVVENWDIHHGVFIDIMILHNYPNGKLPRLWQYGWQAYLELKSCSNRNYTKRGKLVEYLLKTMRLMPKRFLLIYAVKQVWRYRNIPCDNYFHLYISQPIKRSIYPKALFEKSCLVDFETIQLRAPIGLNEYLTILFGDYMKIPDLNSIKYHQHTTKWSSEQSYKPRKKGILSDEKYYW